MKVLFESKEFGIKAYEAPNGMTFKSKCLSASGDYIVEYGDKMMQLFDSRVDAVQFARFQRDAAKFAQAKDSGLNDETSELVAAGKMSLEEALGDMDTDLECDSMEFDAFHSPGDLGGEDDATPPLEVIMAGGQAAWDYQNERMEAEDMNGRWSFR